MRKAGGVRRRALGSIGMETPDTRIVLGGREVGEEDARQSGLSGYIRAFAPDAGRASAADLAAQRRLPVPGPGEVP